MLTNTHSSSGDDELDSFGCNLMNRHERDERCSFDPEPHEYKIDGEVFLSVSSVVSRFFPVFDPDMAIEKIKKGRSWNPGHRYWGLDDQSIKDMWEKKGNEASAKGTYLHEQIERYYLERTIDPPPEFSYFEEFVVDHAHIQPYRTEWRIFDETEGVAGTIDFVAKNGSAFEMYDWKRSLKVVDKITGNPVTHNPWDKGVGQLNDMDDTSYNQYSIQQSMYRYILEKKYELEISTMYLVVIHPEYDRYYKVEVPYLKDKVEYILSTL